MNDQTPPIRPSQRIDILDGWRALSILLVLAGHLVPLGPKISDNNAAVAAAGMALFFTLSGFLITRFLLDRPEPVSFLTRRLFRIVPLAWAAMLALIIANHADARTAAANFLFFANLPPISLLHGGEHLWSLCVEVQFYVAIALLVAIVGKRGLYVIPALCVTVTAWRIANGATSNIVTWFRVDEIFAGATLALVYTSGWLKGNAPKWLSPALLAVLFFASNRFFGPLNYLRPYIAASAVGASLIAAPVIMQWAFTNRYAR
ncbi:MAG TPA: acyltransferase, partial [Sphingomicrobium sp.]